MLQRNIAFEKNHVCICKSDPHNYAGENLTGQSTHFFICFGH